MEATSSTVMIGRAAVELDPHAMVFTQRNTQNRGTGITEAVSTAFQTLYLKIDGQLGRRKELVNM